eukprot:TRINITY_DN24209_c0_g2_i1.p1 TRINITY_DN24209_c0_g2~~TRINITY_DN24209_c0_g2_i1.p1  ORF type:complete len:537 (-),score=67.56 TRINITY_DN24209_c0_g2_i1:135-1745(-)
MIELGNNLTPQQFVVILTVLKPADQMKFLQSLSVELKAEEWPGWKSLFYENRPQCDVQEYSIPGNLDDTEPKKEGEWPWKTDKSLGWERILKHCLGMEGKEVAVGIHWMPANQLLGTADITDQLRILKALQDTGADSMAFVTPIGWSILSQAWDRYRLNFMSGRLMDVMFLFVFGQTTYYLMKVKRAPPVYLVYIMAFLTAKSMFYPCLHMVGTCFEFGICSTKQRFSTMSQICNLWNAVIFTFEMCSGVLLVPLLLQELHCHHKGCDTSAFQDRPVLFCGVVSARWIYFLMASLCVNSPSGFGRHVFPAVHAMSRPASLSFILFLMLSVMALFQAYMCFPIPENSDSLVMAFMKIFRFSMLGDFDVWELEGVDEVVDGSVTDGNLHASIDDGRASRKYHKGIMLFVVISGITVTILSMNVAIGVVGSLYDEAKEISLQIQSHYKAGYLFKLQLAKRIRTSLWNSMVRCSAPDKEKTKGQYLCCALRSDIISPRDTASDGEDPVLKEVDTLKAEVKKLKEMVTEQKKMVQQLVDRK